MSLNVFIRVFMRHTKSLYEVSKGDEQVKQSRAKRQTKKERKKKEKRLKRFGKSKEVSSF